MKKPAPFATIHLILSFAVVLIITALYSFEIGPVFYTDSHIYADRAKNFAIHGNLHDFVNLTPPLYSIIITPAYLFPNPTINHQIILTIHILLYASTFFPMVRLLRTYSHVIGNEALFLAVMLSIAPFLLPYTVQFLSEAVYFPIFFWFCYFLMKGRRKRWVSSWIGVGLFMSLCVLARSAAWSVVLSFTALMFLEVIRGHQQGFDKKAFVGYVFSLVIFTIIYGSWKIYEHFFVNYQEHMSYFKWDWTKSIFLSQLSIDVNSSWLANVFLYCLTAPLSIVGIFTFVLIFLRPKILWKDQLVTFSLLCVTGAALSLILQLPPTFAGGNLKLTLNRYMAPYIILLFLIAFRYRRYFNPLTFNIVATVLIVLNMSYIPYYLQCHHPDSLIFFMKGTSSLPAIPSCILYSLVLLIPPAMLLRRKAWAKLFFGVATLVIFMSWHSSGNSYSWSHSTNSGEARGSKLTGCNESEPRGSVVTSAPSM